MKTYGEYYAVKDLGKGKKKRWQAVASIPAYAESCIAGAEAVFNLMGLDYKYARDDKVLKQRNFAGFSKDYVALDISHELYEWLADLELAQRNQRQLARLQKYVDSEDHILYGMLQRRLKVAEEFAEYLD